MYYIGGDKIFCMVTIIEISQLSPPRILLVKVLTSSDTTVVVGNRINSYM